MNYEINDYTDLLIFENKLYKTFHKIKQLYMLYIHKIMENQIDYKIIDCKIKKIHQYFFNNFFSKYSISEVKWLLRLNPTINTLILNWSKIRLLIGFDNKLKNVQLLLQLNPQKYYYFKNPKNKDTKMRYYRKIQQIAKLIQ